MCMLKCDVSDPVTNRLKSLSCYSQLKMLKLINLLLRNLFVFIFSQTRFSLIGKSQIEICHPTLLGPQTHRLLTYWLRHSLTNGLPVLELLSQLRISTFHIFCGLPESRLVTLVDHQLPTPTPPASWVGVSPHIGTAEQESDNSSSKSVTQSVTWDVT